MNQERAPLSASADASVVRGAVHQESMLARGIFTANCVRPKPGCEARYMPLRAFRSFCEGRSLDRSEQARLDDVVLEMRGMEEEVWNDTFPNVVCIPGKNLALDTFLAGSGYTVTGPFLGLISSVSYTAVANTDTMASHTGWLEAGATNAPTYTAPRKTAVWAAAAAGAKALSAALTFAITGNGTVKGCFLAFGTGALSTIDNTAGTLLSAGTFTGGDKIVSNTDSINVSYSLAF